MNAMSIEQLVQTVLNERDYEGFSALERERARRYAADVALEAARRLSHEPSESPWKTIFGHNADGSEQDVTVCKACGRPEDDMPTAQWISVDVRLPEFGQPVVYFFDEVGTSVGHYQGKDDHGLPVFAGKRGFLAGDVTHWIPLPPRPTLTKSETWTDSVPPSDEPDAFGTDPNDYAT